MPRSPSVPQQMFRIRGHNVISFQSISRPVSLTVLNNLNRQLARTLFSSRALKFQLICDADCSLHFWSVPIVPLFRRMCQLFPLGCGFGPILLPLLPRSETMVSYSNYVLLKLVSMPFFADTDIPNQRRVGNESNHEGSDKLMWRKQISSQSLRTPQGKYMSLCKSYISDCTCNCTLP